MELELTNALREPAEPLSDELKRAYRRWQGTISFFESVSDPKLVELAIFEMEAAQRQYVYLLEKMQ